MKRMNMTKGFAACAVVMSAVAISTSGLSGCTPLRVATHSVGADEARVPQGRYMLEPNHWSITFDVEHLKFSRFTMRFNRAQAALDWKQGGLDASAVDVSIDAASVDTNVPLLDTLVKGPEMFDAASHPAIRFVSTQFSRTGAASGKLHGDLTIRGVTRPVTLDVTFNGYGVNPLTKVDTLGFSARGDFSRAQFGLAKWYPAVGDNVRVRIETEFARRPAP